MSVVPLTLTISLCLVFTFVLFFLREFTRRRFSGAESESLLPLADEMPRLATVHGVTADVTFAANTAAVVAEARNATSGGCGNHSLDTKHDADACTRNCAACRLRALHRGAASAIISSSISAA